MPLDTFCWELFGDLLGKERQGKNKTTTKKEVNWRSKEGKLYCKREGEVQKIEIGVKNMKPFLLL